MSRISVTLVVLLLAGLVSAGEQELNPGATESFGWSVSIYSDTLIVGAPTDSELGTQAGAAYIYERVSGVWSLEDRVTAFYGEQYDFFGTAVAIWGDYALISAPGDDDNGNGAGAVYVFKRLSGGWYQDDKLTAGALGAGEFGFGNAVSLYGNVGLVGDAQDGEGGFGSGGAYIYERTGDTWAQVTKLKASNVQAGAHFGASVAVFGLGSYALVGAPQHDGKGAAYLFDNFGGTWQETTKLNPPDRATGDSYGSSVAGTVLGDFIVVGSPNDDVHALNSGSAFAFAYSGGTWNLESKLIPKSGGDADDNFGEAVAISFGGNIAVGIPGRQGREGAVHAFRRKGSSWIAVGERPSNLVIGDSNFGFSVAMSANDVVVGAPENEDGVGAAFCYNWSDLLGIHFDNFETGNTNRWSSTVP